MPLSRQVYDSLVEGAMEGGHSAVRHMPELIHCALNEMLVMGHHQNTALERRQTLQQA